MVIANNSGYLIKYEFQISSKQFLKNKYGP